MQYSQMLYGRLAKCLNVFLLSWLSKDAVLQSILERNTHIWTGLFNVVVYETWVISSKLMKRPGSMTHMLHPRSRLLAAMYWLWLWVKVKLNSPLFKLWISVAWSSRWDLNLTVLTDSLVYQTVVRNKQISKWAFEIWWVIDRILS